MTSSRPLVAFLLVSMFCHRIGSAAEPKADVWVVSGQSNAIGRATLPGPEPDKRVQMFTGREWVTAVEPMCGGSVGPWLFAAQETAKTIPVRIVNGGCYSGLPIENWDEGKQGYTLLMAALKTHAAQTPVLLFLQGESDGSDGSTTETYLSKLRHLMSEARSAAQNPKMLIVIVQLGKWKNTKGDFMPIREAQRQFVATDANAVLVPGLDCDIKDYVHYSNAGCQDLGIRIARALAKVRYGVKDATWPGPVLDRAVLGKSADIVVAHFAEVKKLGGVVPEFFAAVNDKGSVIKCTKAVAENTRVALTFEQPLKLPAKIICGYGQVVDSAPVDEAGNHAPAVQLDISTGTLPDDKETKAPNGAGVVAASKK
jgi:hypothetical protein